MTDRGPLVRRAVLTWILFIPVAVVNGVLREKALRPVLGERTARQVSSAMLSALFVVNAWAMIGRLVVTVSSRRLIAIGAGWSIASALFDFGFGHFIDGKPWSVLAADYNLFKGRLWSLNLLTMLVTPLFVRRKRRASFRG